MSLVANSRNPELCQHAYLRKHKPDEPGGYVCLLSPDHDGCSACDGDCPLVMQVAAECPDCSSPDSPVHLYHDEQEDLYGCDECGQLWFPDQLVAAWEQRVSSIEAQRQKGLEHAV